MAVGFEREFLQITQESAYGTPVVSPVRGTSQLVMRLSGANQFTMRAVPVVVDVPYGGGWNVTAESISDKQELKGSLTTELCYSQASMLMGMGLTRINAGQTLPWVTTEPVNQLVSVTIDHAIWQDDTGAYKRSRYKGVKVDGGKIELSEDSQKVMLTLDLIGGTPEGNPYDSSTDPDATVFPQPTDAEYPTDFVLFIHANGGLTLSGGVFAEFTQLTASWKNMLQAQWFANRFVNKLRSYGRKITLDATCNILATPDVRTAFKALTAVTGKLILTNTTHTITLDLKTNARYENLDDDLKLDQTFQRKITLGSRYDKGAAHTDFSFTYA